MAKLRHAIAINKVIFLFGHTFAQISTEDWGVSTPTLVQMRVAVAVSM